MPDYSNFFAPGIGDVRVFARLDPSEMDIDPNQLAGSLDGLPFFKCLMSNRRIIAEETLREIYARAQIAAYNKFVDR
jgi:hypothetical protein